MFRIIEVERILVKLSPEPARQHLHLPLLRRPLVTLRANKRNEVRRTLTLLTTEILPFQETVADNRTGNTMPSTSGNIHHVLTVKRPRPLNIIYTSLKDQKNSRYVYEFVLSKNQTKSFDKF